jgi:AcrR family transcriptional regulator
MATAKKRRYHAPRRQEAATETRRAIIDSARRTFLERGYAATTMAAIAKAAGVAVDTVYATVGSKPAIFRLLVETAISGSGEPVAALERDYVRAIQAEPDPAVKLALYARAIRTIHGRLSPLFKVLQAAASQDDDLAALWTDISNRRAKNMRLLAKELKETGELRDELSVDEIADVLWTTNSAELYLLLVEQRGWKPARFERWLADTWGRLFLAEGRP